MQNFSFFEIIESQAPMVIKALNKVVLNGGRKVIVEVAGENNGKSDKSGKKRSRKENAAEGKNTSKEKKEKKEAAGKKENPVGKNADIQPHAARNGKTTGSSSSSTMTTRISVAWNRISWRKAGRSVKNARNNDL